MSPARIAVLVSPLLALVLLAACAGGDDEADTSGDGNMSAAAPAETATVAPTSTPESSPASSGGGVSDDYDYDSGSASPSADGTPTSAAAGAGDARETEIEDFAFEQGLTVPAGTTVRWTNRDRAPHRVASVEQVFRSDTLNEGDSFEFSFEEPGTYDYICAIHPEMTGSVTVE